MTKDKPPSVPSNENREWKVFLPEHLLWLFQGRSDAMLGHGSDGFRPATPEQQSRRV